jgi:colanic acid/amylovoran biosynthesis glycosyltransferase
MGTLCIIKGYKQLISETFIDSHIRELSGDKVVLYDYYPEYTYNSRAIRYFYSLHRWRRKLERLLPAFLYDKLITSRAQTQQTIFDFMGGFFARHKIDCILAEYGTNGADIVEVAKHFSIPLLVHFHGHDAHRKPDIAPYQEKYQHMFSYASKIFSVSHLMTQTLVGLGAPSEKIIYNPYGPRPYFFDISPSYAPNLIAVGRFADIKAPYLTIMSFSKVAQDFPSSKLLMIGDGPLLEACKSLTSTLQLTSQVEFAGALTHDQFLPKVKDACAFVQHSVTTSYGDAEGTPNSVLEAMASGLPVISTRHAGIQDIVIENETGFLVNERDIDSMAEAMRKILKNQSLCVQLGQQARAHVQQNFPIQRHIMAIQKEIDSLRKST